ncbi:ATP-binding protein [Mucilaginibacter limnophilus]|uniref:histidine kinase n=1 Tax=Mucilaginibacter limnophilus TaxID=1932778 RepID=A0A437MRP7_9SPHI|nr:ATP-binding protein [Mucilaginibacter limnophilus]RVU00284.1 ATP-binding protein [Mucilaginibacter limnophilus]
MNEEFFRISSGLKNLIGSELITDNFVAVFELVKNSFDAKAHEVVIRFENLESDNGKIVILDNGKGMDYDDLLNKWLFVAYSAKKDKSEDADDYRNRIDLERFYAGAKGVGRFSCDRLGRYLNLISIKNEPNAKIENLNIDWHLFENDQKEEFINIPIQHQVLTTCPYPISHGTILEISGIHKDEWTRDNLKRLKDKLSKLVRPDLNKTVKEKNFKIKLEVPGELGRDREEKIKREKKGESEGSIYYNTVNGEIENFIFEALNIRTTKITSSVSVNGDKVITTLNDRETFIYEIEEVNRFNELKNTSITLYFLNKSSKDVFKRRMGIRAVDYGSVFVYKNGFRIYPYGERGDDSLGIDNRAVQGYNRYIGLRNLIGQLDIQGNDSDLKEATSRDAGLVKTKAYYQLADASPYADSLLIDTLKRLEKYVVEVTEWGLNDDNYDVKDSEKAKENLVKLISNIVDDKSLLRIDYNKDIINILNQQEEKSAKKLVANFKRVAAESQDQQLLNDAKALEARINRQSNALNSASTELKEVKEKGRKLQEELELQIAETLFAKADRGTDKTDLLSVQHHIYRHSAQHITGYIDQLVKLINEGASKDDLLKMASRISFENKKIITLSRFVTKAQFDTTVTKIEADIVSFINEYVVNVYQQYKHLIMNNQNLKITASAPKGLKFTMSFRPIEVIIILDNLLSNAFKANAKNVSVSWSQLSNNEVEVRIKDDGVGIPDANLSRVFDPRFTTTNGSGLGLYHTKDVVEKMKGTISVSNNLKGAEFTIRFKK